MKHLKPKITKRTNAGGTISFCVDAGIIDGKRQRRFFPSKTAAEEHAEQVQQARAKHGAMAFSLNKHQQVDAIRALETLKEKEVDVSLVNVVSFYLLHNKPKNGKKLLSDVVAEFLRSLSERGKKPRYLKALRCAYRKFTETFGGKHIHAISRAEAEEWLNTRTVSKQDVANDDPASIAQRRLSPLTKCNYIRDLGMLFRYAMGEGYCAENIFERIKKPSVPNTPAEILTVAEAVRLLSGAKTNDSSLVPYLVIGLFAGLRSSELETLDWNEINLHSRRIEVKAEKAKTSRRRFVTISDNLHAWLKPHEKMEGCIVSNGWRDRLQKLTKLAEFEKWPRNGLRHSFGSYHYAYHEDPNKTAMEMGHESSKMLFAHYRELVTHDEAARFWNILPPENGWLIRNPVPKKTNRSDRKILKVMEQALKEARTLN